MSPETFLTVWVVIGWALVLVPLIVSSKWAASKGWWHLIMVAAGVVLVYFGWFSLGVAITGWAT
jgi:hypothetical protein